MSKRFWHPAASSPEPAGAVPEPPLVPPFSAVAAPEPAGAPPEPPLVPPFSAVAAPEPAGAGPEPPFVPPFSAVAASEPAGAAPEPPLVPPPSTAPSPESAGAVPEPAGAVAEPALVPPVSTAPSPEPAGAAPEPPPVPPVPAAPSPSPVPPLPAALSAGPSSVPPLPAALSAGPGPVPPVPAAPAPGLSSEPPPFPAELSADPPRGESAGRHSLGGRRLAAFALTLALVSALAGGLIGGFIVSRTSDDGVAPGFSLGTVPPGLTNRPPASVAGIAARVLPAVVMIKVDGSQGTGSGFIIQGGYVITDNHVVTLDGRLRNASLKVVFNDGRTVSATLVGTDPYSDIAVIRPKVTGRLPVLSLGNSAGVEVGDPVVAFGSPLGLAGTVTSGIVSALHRPVQPGGVQGVAAQAFISAIQTDAPINPGNSGGPLVNGQGEVIGVNAAIETLGDPLAGQSGSIGLGFAIPINQARLIAMEIIRTGRATHAVIGAMLDSTYRGSGAKILAMAQRGTFAVTPRGPAAMAGLRPGDVIVSFGGQRITSAAALTEAIRSRDPGARVTVVFLRAGLRHVVLLTLGSAPS
jgi:putative serine protease PepD